MSQAPPTREEFRGDVLWNFASLALLGVAGIGLNVLISRKLGAEALGIFNQVWAVYIFFSQLAVGGIDLSVLKEVAPARDQARRMAAIAWGALVPTACLALSLSLVFYGLRGTIADLLESPGVAAGMASATPGLFFFALNKVLFGILNGMQRMRAYALLQSTRFVGLLCGFFVSLALHQRPDQVAFVLTFSEGLTFIGLALLVGRNLRWRKLDPWLPWCRRHLNYGVRSFLSGVLLELNSRIDILMLGYFHDDALVGVYSFAAMLAEGVFQLLVKLQNNYNPILAQQLARGQLIELKALVKRGKRASSAILVAVCLAAYFVYPFILQILDNPTFESGRIPYAILLMGIALSASYMPFQQILLMAGRPGRHTQMMLLIVLTNVIGNALLIPYYAAAGAAAATAAALLAANIFLLAFARRFLGLWL